MAMRRRRSVHPPDLECQVASALRMLAVSRAAGLPFEAYLHRAHLEDLIDTAIDQGVDVDAWVDRSALPPVALVEG
jgi:hypothetical protein